MEERQKALQVLNEHFKNTSRIVHLEDEQARLVLDAMIEFRQPAVMQRSEQLLQAYKEGFDAAVETLVGANKVVQQKRLQ